MDKYGRLKKVCKMIVEICAEVQTGEELLIVADTATEQRVIDAFWESGAEVGARVSLITRTPPQRPHELPTIAVAWAMKGVDVILDISYYDILHSLPIREALLDYGARLINATGHTAETLTAPNIADVDYVGLHKKALRLVEVLEAGTTLKYTNPKGTNLTAGIKGRKWHPLDGIAHTPGSFAVFPVGEVLGSAVPGTPNGTVVLDYLATFGRLSVPMVLTVENGWVTEVKGGPEAERLKKLWADVENANYIGELGGIGINCLNEITGRPDAIEEQMKLGVVHIGFGDSLTYGDKVSSKMHLNGSILDIVVEVDGEKVVADYELLV